MLERDPSDWGGAIAILMACVDPDTIQLIGGWQSNTMLRYLHTTSNCFTDGLAVRMSQYDDYALIPPAYTAG